MKLLVAILGKMDYKEALSIQERLLKLRQQGLIEDTLLLLEHPPVLTMGVRSNRANILTPEEVLKAQGVNIYEVNRGGDVTYHGPGQIVGYPILDLKKHGRDIPDFFRKIEETFIQLLKEEYGITAGRNSKYPGVWVGDEKITAIGCAVKRWVTMHGFAFNVNTQLEHFLWINPCGITDKGVTSLQKILGYPQDLNKVNEQVARYLCKIFNLQPKIIDKQKLYQITGRD
ncbi:MAG: Octanoyltransferase [Peptococcaceae bacterium]|jgi:lipoyl(octanoyl) transferase|nr:Octanoyltransferase [Peptococcaceae bacterium]